MGTQSILFRIVFMAAAALALPLWPAVGAPAPVIMGADDAPPLVELALHEIRRYLYLRTGELLPVTPLTEKESDASYAAVWVGLAGDPFAQRAGEAPELPPDGFWLKSVDRDGHRTVFVVGGGETGALYGAYRFAELLGVRFYLHGDVIPDARIALALPETDEVGAPLFELRGIQPFHDFPEGPDWWNADEYKATLAQLPKMGMNFFGLHTYPEDRPAAEPTVWIGLAEDAAEDGSVRHSYPAIYYNTLLPVGWGFQAKPTSAYTHGAAALFDRDGYSSDVLRGFEPKPETPEDCNEVFNRAGALLRDAFTFARSLGIKTCIGTETPLVVPREVRRRLGVDDPAAPISQEDILRLYEGIFTRIARAHPVDYYWFWTPENWTWEGVKKDAVQATVDDVLTAIQAAKNVRAPFALATCGWVLGPQYDRALFDQILPKDMPLSCINRQVGFEPVEPGFAHVHGRPKWAIPWLEDDPALHSPQLWVGRMRRDAVDALRYGCTGLMGIHWRTRILGPNVSALAKAAWEQTSWAQAAEKTEGVLGGNVVTYEGAEIAGTDDDPLYRSVRYGLRAYRFKVPNEIYTVTLKLCEPHYDVAEKRVFGVTLQGKQVLEHMDVLAVAGKNTALDKSYEGIEVTDGMLEVGFTSEIEMPCVAALVVQGPGYVRKVNCGGPAYNDFSADMASSEEFMPVGDFYADWARAHFGEPVGAAAAAIFEAVDCKLPRPSNWIGGPGGYAPEARPWTEVEKDYAFVEQFAALRDQVNGAANRERFDYWLANFRFMRGTAQMCCAWHECALALEQAKAAVSDEEKQRLAREAALPAYAALTRAVSEAYKELLATVTTTGAMGSVTNLEQHTFPDMIEKPAKELEALLGTPLPPEVQLPRAYNGAPRLIVTAPRTLVEENEALRVKVIVLAEQAPASVSVFWRALGTGAFAEARADCAGRATYTVNLGPFDEDIEYYVEAAFGGGLKKPWPVTAPEIGQTVVVAGKFAGGA